jgi:DNA-binding CsgD family transcriptional regulator
MSWLPPLVRQLRTAPDRVSSGEASLLLQFDVDGAQCLLIERRSPAPDHALSPREQQIAGMVARGFPDKTIAAELGISRWTVATHLRRIYVKLGVHSRAAMVAKLASERLAWPELASPG